MWRPDWLRPMRRARYVLRLGQQHMQLWLQEANGLRSVTSVPCPLTPATPYDHIAELASQLGRAAEGGSSLQVVVDSRWLPVSLLHTGHQALKQEQVQALAKHRFTTIFGELAQSWQIQTQYLAGDENALAFACPPGLLQALQTGIGGVVDGGASKIRLEGIQPTITWLLNMQRGQLPRSQAGSWVVLAEHDRSLMAYIANGQIAAFHPCGPVLTRPDEVLDAVKHMALRCGMVAEAQPVVSVYSFEQTAGISSQLLSHGVAWHVLGSQKESA